MKYLVADRELTVYNFSRNTSAPLIILNDGESNAKTIIDQLLKLGANDFVFAVVNKLDWNGDLSPWPAESPFRGASFSGNGDKYLKTMEKKIVPYINAYLDEMGNEISWIGLAGYSLAGLFSLYAASKSAYFERIASVSGSLWYPGFAEYLLENGLNDNVEKVYLSLGDREDRGGNQLTATVREKTEEIYDLLNDQLTVKYELNAGDHFQEPELRIAKAIAYLLKDQ